MLKEPFCLFWNLSRAAIALPEFLVSGIPSDEVNRIGLEEVAQSVAPFLLVQLGYWFRRQYQKRITRVPRGIFLDLRDQRRNQIEGLVNCGKFLGQPDHAVVILEGMHADPWQAVFAADQVLIE